VANREGSLKGQRRWVALAVGLVGLAIPSSAAAATIVGETAPIGNSCFDNNVSFVQSQVGAPPTYTVPFDGVLTDFTAWGETVGDQTRLLVLSPPSSGTLYRVAAKSEFVTFTAIGLSTFPAQVPARAGEVIALFNNPCFRETPGNPENIVSIYNGPDPPVGSDAEYVQSGVNERVTLSATLEPDCDSDGLGDETQDPSVLGGSCPIRARTLTLDANKNKVKKGKKVTLSGLITELLRQGECQTAQAVELQRKKPSQTTFTTVEQLQTDAAGSFSAKKKVKKTFEYRAQVAETATCAAGLSNAEKVKVKKPK
jgi:hypothetical protein